MLYLSLAAILAVFAWALARFADEAPPAPATAETAKKRKPRVKKTMAQRLAEEAKRVANLRWDAAKSLIGAAGDAYQNIVEGRARLMRYVKESETLNDPAKVEEKRQRLRERLANLDARAAIAREYIPKGTAALRKVDALFDSLGGHAMDIFAEGRDPTPDEARALIGDALTSEDLALLAAQDDPYAAYRRAKSAEDEGEDAMPDEDEDIEESDEDADESEDESDEG